jgi:iron complex outermembrane receptor protein
MNKSAFSATTTLALSLGLGAAAVAEETQQPAAPALEEVVVTAQHFSETLQKAAISVTALSGQQLEQNGVSDVTNLTEMVPTFRANLNSGPYTNFSIRGISNFTTNALQDNGVVINEDGVPLARPTSDHGMFFDLDRVEILKGPQGILYGRNATGGVVNVIPRNPGSEYSGDAMIDVGSFNLVSVNVGADMPITDDLTTRAAVMSVKHDGYYSDGTGDEDSQAARLTFLYRPNEDLHIRLVGDYSHDGGNGPGASLIYSTTATGKSGFIAGPWSGLAGNNPAIGNAFTAAGSGATPRNLSDNFQDNANWGVTGTLDWINPLGQLTAIAAHRNADVNWEGSVPTFYNGETGASHQDSLEVRLASIDTGRLSYQAGLFTIRETGRDFQYNEQNTGLSVTDFNWTNKTYAAFSQLTYSITGKWRFVAGARLNQDDKANQSPRYTIPNFPFTTVSLRNRPAYTASEYVGDIDKSATFNSFTYKLGMNYDVTDNSLLYVDYSTGFKAGGFSFGPPGGVSYSPEHVKAYTLGSKNRFFDNTVQLNLEGYYLDYKDQQIQFFASLPSLGNFTVTQNVAASSIYGLELDGKYLLSNTTLLKFDGQVQHATYDNFTYVTPNNVSTSQTCPVTPAAGGYAVDCSGKPLINAPHVVLQGGIEQTLSLPGGHRLVASVEERYESARETQLNYLPETRAGSYHETNLSLTYNEPKDRWSVQAYVMNLEDALVYGIINPGRNYTIQKGGLLDVSLQPPRTAGVRVSAHF